MQQKEFKQHTGIVAPMMSNNIDTDQIIPSREMKKVSKAGLGEGLFAGQRYILQENEISGRTINPDFVLNNAPFNQATILLSAKNFGCGSSREHAVWALKEYGFKAVIARSFGNIFRINCLRNGILPVTLGDVQLQQINTYCKENPADKKITIDLENLQIKFEGDTSFNFELESHFQDMLINGLDFISLTMKRQADIDSFIKIDRSARPWAHLN